MLGAQEGICGFSRGILGLAKVGVEVDRSFCFFGKLHFDPSTICCVSHSSYKHRRVFYFVFHARFYRFH